MVYYLRPHRQSNDNSLVSVSESMIESSPLTEPDKVIDSTLYKDLSIKIGAFIIPLFVAMIIYNIIVSVNPNSNKLPGVTKIHNNKKVYKNSTCKLWALLFTSLIIVPSYYLIYIKYFTPLEI